MITFNAKICYSGMSEIMSCHDTKCGTKKTLKHLVTCHIFSYKGPEPVKLKGHCSMYIP
jgi:hypothetical protein